MATSERGRVVGSVVLTSVAQASAMALGGVFAVLIAARFGSDARTDGFFAAYGAYGFVVLLAQSTRLSLVPKLVDEGFEAFGRYLAAAAVIWAATGVLFVLAGVPLAALLTGNETAQDNAREALLILWPAAGAQLFASLTAAMLGVLDDFARAAFAYAAGGVTSIAGFLVLAGDLEVAAVPVALLAGSLVTAVPLGWALAARGWRPRGALAGSPRRAGWIVVGAASVAVPQLLYLVTMVFAGALGEGEPTVYSYAFFGAGLLVAVVASSVSIVLAAPLAETWDGDPASLLHSVEETFRTGLMLLVALLGIAALAGDEVGELLLAEFSARQIDATVSALLWLGPSVLAAMAIAIPVIALYARGRHLAIAAVGLPVLALHTAASAFAESLDALAAIASSSTLVFAALVLWLLHGRAWPRAAARLLAETAALALPAAGVFALSAVVLGRGVLGALAGALMFAALAVAIPRNRALLLRLAGRGRR
jgi:peptidoglycan biosynthesis protein MviN/MurJ (putative lipid II flippase)